MGVIIPVLLSQGEDRNGIGRIAVDRQALDNAGGQGFGSCHNRIRRLQAQELSRFAEGVLPAQVCLNDGFGRGNKSRLCHRGAEALNAVGLTFKSVRP